MYEHILNDKVTIYELTIWDIFPFRWYGSDIAAQNEKSLI